MDDGGVEVLPKDLFLVLRVTQSAPPYRRAPVLHSAASSRHLHDRAGPRRVVGALPSCLFATVSRLPPPPINQVFRPRALQCSVASALRRRRLVRRRWGVWRWRGARLQSRRCGKPPDVRETPWATAADEHTHSPQTMYELVVTFCERPERENTTVAAAKPLHDRKERLGSCRT